MQHGIRACMQQSRHCRFLILHVVRYGKAACYALLRIVTYLRGTCWRHGRFELEFHAELRDVGHLGGYSREMGDLQWPVGPGVVVPGPSGADKRSWRHSKCTSRQCKRSCLGGDGLATRAAGGRVESKRSIEETFGDAGCNSQWWHQSYEAGLAQTSLQHHSRKAVVRAGFAIIRIARNKRSSRKGKWMALQLTPERERQLRPTMSNMVQLIQSYSNILTMSNYFWHPLTDITKECSPAGMPAGFWATHRWHCHNSHAQAEDRRDLEYLRDRHGSLGNGLGNDQLVWAYLGTNWLGMTCTQFSWWGLELASLNVDFACPRSPCVLHRPGDQLRPSWRPLFGGAEWWGALADHEPGNKKCQVCKCEDIWQNGPHIFEHPCLAEKKRERVDRCFYYIYIWLYIYIHIHIIRTE